MRIILLSGSRADLGGLESVHASLIKFGQQPIIRHLPSSLKDVPDLFDLVIVLGDRFEVLRAVVEVYLMKVPIVHLSGGDVTEGSQDDGMRHAITKLASLHFATCEDSAKRIIQLGEEPWRVKTVGYPGIDNLPDLDLKEVKEQAGIAHFTDDYMIVIWHPNTLANNTQVLDEVETLTKALNQFKDDILVIGPNGDSGNDIVGSHLNSWSLARAKGGLRTIYTKNLPRHVYLTLLKHCKCLVGNSSSGYYEAPSFGTPVLNIGNRQRGRIEPPNIWNCSLDTRMIVHDLKQVVLNGRFIPGNPYHTGNAADKIAEAISKIQDPRKLLFKRFYQLKHC